MTVLVTGANGFVGRELCGRLAKLDFRVRAALRAAPDSWPDSPGEWVSVGPIGPDTDWRTALDGVQQVVHLAARAHVMRESAPDPYEDFHRINVVGTERLARQAVAAGVRRLVFVSSIKVNGERTVGTPFRPEDETQPEDAYGRSKLEAELVLHEISRQTGIETVIVRPPLVYGPGVKGNFLSLLQAVQRGWPLPLASCDNRRSLVGLSNLVDLLVLCATHPAAAGQTFLAADGEDLSTPELLRRVAQALGTRVRLFPFPPTLLRAMAQAVGRGSAVERLCGSLQVDASKARSLLGWQPPLTVDDELARTARWLRSELR